MFKECVKPLQMAFITLITLEQFYDCATASASFTTL